MTRFSPREGLSTISAFFRLDPEKGLKPKANRAKHQQWRASEPVKPLRAAS